MEDEIELNKRYKLIFRDTYIAFKDLGNKNSILNLTTTTNYDISVIDKLLKIIKKKFNKKYLEVEKEIFRRYI